MSNKKILAGVIVIVVVIILIVVFNHGGNSNSTQTIKIGALYPLTGGLASYGEPAYNTARIAIDDINANGGVGGKRLELVVGNHKCDPKEALSAFEKLSSVDNVHIFTSAACTGTALSIIPGLQSKDAVLFGAVLSGNKLTAASPYFFRNWASDAQESKLLADRVVAMGYKKVSVLYEDTDYAKGLKVAMENYLTGSGVTLISESFTSGATDVRSQLTKLQSSGSDVLFVSVQTVTSGEIVLKQMEQIGYKPRALFVNDNILKAAQLVKDHAALLEGAVGGDYTIPSSVKLNEVLAKYKSKYGVECPQINICAVEYDTIQMLAQAIKANGESAKGVASYLGSSTYDGVSGQISFDQNNDRSGAAYSLFVIKAGQMVPLN